MNTNYRYDWRSAKLDQIIQDAIQECSRPFMRKKDEIIDFIMENPDLSITNDQIVFLLRSSSPAVNPMRKDYFDVFARLVSESKAHGDMTLVKSVYLSIPFYPADKDYPRKKNLLQSGIQYFLSLDLYQFAGELYVHLAAGMSGSIMERILLCEKALEVLDRTSKEYACISAMREMFCHMKEQKNKAYYHYCAFGETLFQKRKSIFLSPIFSCYAMCEKSESLCSDAVIMKGERESFEALTSLASSGYDKELVDEEMPVNASKRLYEDKELVRLPEEKVICQADGKEYLCHVFLIHRVENNAEKILGDIIETNCFADGIGLIRTVLLIGNKKYVYDLCAYSVKGGEGILPCHIGNQWYYRQADCPDSVDMVLKREIVAQDGEKYVLSGWNYAGRNPILDGLSMI